MLPFLLQFLRDLLIGVGLVAILGAVVVGVLATRVLREPKPKPSTIQLTPVSLQLRYFACDSCDDCILTNYDFEPHPCPCGGTWRMETRAEREAREIVEKSA